MLGIAGLLASGLYALDKAFFEAKKPYVWPLFSAAFEITKIIRAIKAKREDERANEKEIRGESHSCFKISNRFFELLSKHPLPLLSIRCF